jgi:hypothetical protein
MLEHGHILHIQTGKDESKRASAKPRSGTILAVCLRFGAHPTVESVSVLPEHGQLELQASGCWLFAFIQGLSGDSKKSMTGIFAQISTGAGNNTFATERNLESWLS